MFAQVGELDIQSHEHALFIFSRLRDLGIRVGKKILVSCGQDVMTQSNQNRLQMTGEILIQLELHCRVPVFQTLSCARSAA